MKRSRMVTLVLTPAAGVALVLAVALQPSADRPASGDNRPAPPAAAPVQPAARSVAEVRTAAGSNAIDSAENCGSPSGLYLPTYLPPEVVPTPQIACGQYNVMVDYRLVSPANLDTLPPDGVPTVADDSQHPASILSFDVVENPHNLRPESAADVEWFSVTEVTLASGVPARASVPRDGYGPHRLEWATGGKLFTLLTTRGNTDQGVSGLAMPTLIQIADGIQQIDCDHNGIPDGCPR